MPPIARSRKEIRAERQRRGICLDCSQPRAREYAALCLRCAARRRLASRHYYHCAPWDPVRRRGTPPKCRLEDFQ